MLSVGSAAFRADKTLVATFEANLVELPGAAPHPETMAWWSGHPAAWEASRRDARPAEIVMQEYCAWLDALPGRPVFVAYPAGFDFTFVRWYLMRFAGRCPFGFASLDIKSYAMAVLGTQFSATTKRAMPRSWFDRKEHPHRALDDAIEQGELFCNMLASRTGELSPVVEPAVACALSGTDDERIALTFVDPDGDGDTVSTRIEVAVGGLSADVLVPLARDGIAELWSGLRGLQAGAAVGAARLTGAAGETLVEVVPRGSDVFAVRATIRDPDRSGQQLAVSFVMDARALREAI